jgi:low affinity Fe/Cu permease
MERVKAHYMARINRNLEAVAREKSTFNDRLALKKQESESMSEAVSLCAKSAAKAPAAPLAMAAAADSISKTS